MISGIPMRRDALVTGRFTNRIMLAAAVLASMVVTPGAGADTRVIAPPGVAVVGPYSPGMLAGDFLYVSGQGGRER